MENSLFSPPHLFFRLQMKVFFENVHYYKATPYLSTSSLFQGKEREKKFHFQLKSSNLDKAHKKVTSMVSEKEERLLVKTKIKATIEAYAKILHFFYSKLKIKKDTSDPSV